MLSHGITPRRVTVQEEEVPLATFLRTHSSGSIENSLSPSMTTTTCLGMSNDPGDSCIIRSWANVLFPMGIKEEGGIILGSLSSSSPLASAILGKFFEVFGGNDQKAKDSAATALKSLYSRESF